MNFTRRELLERCAAFGALTLVTQLPLSALAAEMGRGREETSAHSLLRTRSLLQARGPEYLDATQARRRRNAADRLGHRV